MAGFFLNLLWGWDAFCAPFIKAETCQQDQTIISISQSVFYSVERPMCYFKEYTHTFPGTSVQQRWRGSWLWRSYWPSISGPSIYCLSHWYAQASGFILLGLCYSKELNLNGKKWALTKAGGFNLLQWFPKGGQAAAATHIPSHKAKQSCRAAAGVYVTGHSL